MKDQTATRNKQNRFMQEKMMAAQRKAEEDSIEKIAAFQKHQKHKYREIEKLRDL